MGLETGSYISNLVATNPLSSDARSEGDDHIRLLKSVLKSTFPNINGAVNPTPTELNYLVGVTSAIQTQLNALTSALAGKASMPAGTVCLFYQAAAPTGWTKITTQNNKALRVVSGSGGSAGGSQPFTTAFASQVVSGSIGYHNLTVAELPPHTHDILLSDNEMGTGRTTEGSGTAGGRKWQTESTGSGDGHSHTFTGTAINLAVQYIDVILASRN